MNISIAEKRRLAALQYEEEQKIKKQQRDQKTADRKKNVYLIYAKLVDDVEMFFRFLGHWTEEPPHAFRAFLEIYQHWNVNGRKLPINCPKRNSNDEKPCPICEYVSYLRKNGKGNTQQVRDINAQVSYIYQVIDRADPVYTSKDKSTEYDNALIGKPKIKLLTLKSQSHSLINGFQSSGNDIVDHDEGTDISMFFPSGKGAVPRINLVQDRVNKRFTWPVFEKSVGVPDEEKMKYIKENMIQLHQHTYMQSQSYDEIAAMLTDPQREAIEYVPSAPKNESAESDTPVASNEQNVNEPMTEKPVISSPTVPPFVVAPPDQPIPTMGRKRWEEIASLGLPYSANDLVKMGIATEKEIPGSYGVEVHPKQEKCLRCSLLPHCLNKFRADHQKSFAGGEPLTESQSETLMGRIRAYFLKIDPSLEMQVEKAAQEVFHQQSEQSASEPDEIEAFLRSRASKKNQQA